MLPLTRVLVDELGCVLGFPSKNLKHQTRGPLASPLDFQAQLWQANPHAGSEQGGTILSKFMTSPGSQFAHQGSSLTY